MIQHTMRGKERERVTSYNESPHTYIACTLDHNTQYVNNDVQSLHYTIYYST